MRVLRAADRIATPWKNGGGVTREVAAWPPGADLGGFEWRISLAEIAADGPFSPPGADLDGFEWRISLAEIAADGPFSTFPGVDRVLTVIQGEGLLLTVDDRMLALDAASPPLDFPGEARVAARLTDGPISDLNVMVRRGA